MHWPIVTFLSGLITFPVAQKLLSSVVSELRNRWSSATAARRLIDRELDPLLKAADELYGKLRSLAEEDFREFRMMPSPAAERIERIHSVNLCSTLYLFAQFWGRLEILRRESFHADLARNKKGNVLLGFLRSLESRRVRLVDRAWQRAIGESVIVEGGSRPDIVLFKKFVEEYESAPELRSWVQPLEQLLRDSKYRRPRQKVLQYGVVVHALIDTLDPKHLTTRERPSYPNKLSNRAKRDLLGRVFGVYLPEVAKEKYVGAGEKIKGRH